VALLKLNYGQGNPRGAKRCTSFCEQKEAKKLFETGPCLFQRHRPKGAKSRFFQKAAAACF
jgi:hypothetical protein